jgi:hypothetical protein
MLNLFLVYQVKAENFLMDTFDTVSPKVNRSHFFMTVGPEMLKYKTSHSFEGSYQRYFPEDSRTYLGANLGVGYRLKISGGFNTATTLSANYLAKKDRKIRKAAKNYPHPVLDSVENHLVYGAHIAQSLEYKFNPSGMLAIAPFVQIGIGAGKSDSSIDYYYDDTINKEFYRVNIEEDLIFQTVSVGFYLMSINGLMSVFRVQKNAITIGTRDSSGLYKLASGSDTKVSNSEKIDGNRDDWSVSVTMGGVF